MGAVFRNSSHFYFYKNFFISQVFYDRESTVHSCRLQPHERNDPIYVTLIR